MLDIFILLCAGILFFSIIIPLCLAFWFAREPECDMAEVFERTEVKAVLFLLAVTAPVIGIWLGLTVSRSAFHGGRNLGGKILLCACIAFWVWMAIGVLLFMLLCAVGQSILS